jgi:hypothetical protein
MISTIKGNSMKPWPMARSAPDQRLREPIVIAVAVTGPGCIAPENDMINTFAKKNSKSKKLPVPCYWRRPFCSFGL